MNDTFQETCGHLFYFEYKDFDQCNFNYTLDQSGLATNNTGNKMCTEIRQSLRIQAATTEALLFTADK